MIDLEIDISMTTNEIKQLLDEYLVTAIERIITEMSTTSEPTPKRLIDKFELVCLDDNHDRMMLRQERLRQYHDSDRAFQMERLKKFSQKIPEHITNIFIERILDVQSSQPHEIHDHEDEDQDEDEDEDQDEDQDEDWPDEEAPVLLSV